MTREQIEARAKMAMAAGVFCYGDWWERLRWCGWQQGREPTDEEMIKALNELLEENNVLTPTPFQLSGSSC